MTPPNLNIQFPEKAHILFTPGYRYRMLRGSRGSAKSWSAARALLLRALAKKERILCAREYQNSISDSILKLLADQIDALDLGSYFDVQKNTIVCANGTEFLFCGLRNNIQSIKSKEAITLCYIEEANTVSDYSWDVLLPTIRAEDSEVWAVWNPESADDPVHKRFIVNPPADCISAHMTWRDNPWFTKELEKMRLHDKSLGDDDHYNWVWEGALRKISEACIFKNRVTFDQDFEAPEGTHFYYGADFGFSQDPATLIRCWIKDECLHIDHEAHGVEIETDNLPAMYDQVPGSRKWPIKADNSRPETISALRIKGFRIAAAAKWQGCVEDGISHLKAYKRIVVHRRCKHTKKEFQNYSWKVDRLTGDILPLIVDAWNHCIDAIRYALDGVIQKKGTSMETWAKLAG